MNKNWARYLIYLNLWVLEHSDPKCYGSSPMSFEDWLDSEGENNG